LRKENIGAIFIMGRVDLALRCWSCKEMGQIIHSFVLLKKKKKMVGEIKSW